jgi:hypothetical protein
MFGSKKTAPTKAPLPNIEGHRVLYVNPKGPGTKAGLIPYFDVITHVEGIQLNNAEYTLANLISKSIDIDTQITVFKMKLKTVRKSILHPNRNWGGPGALGLVARYDNMAPEDKFFAVTYVHPGSPAADAGLRANEDYILGGEKETPKDENSIGMLLTPSGVQYYVPPDASEGERTRINLHATVVMLYVYNAPSDTVRIVALQPAQIPILDPTLSAATMITSSSSSSAESPKAEAEAASGDAAEAAGGAVAGGAASSDAKKFQKKILGFSAGSLKDLAPLPPARKGAKHTVAAFEAELTEKEEHQAPDSIAAPSSFTESDEVQALSPMVEVADTPRSGDDDKEAVEASVEASVEAKADAPAEEKKESAPSTPVVKPESALDAARRNSLVGATHTTATIAASAAATASSTEATRKSSGAFANWFSKAAEVAAGVASKVGHATAEVASKVGHATAEAAAAGSKAAKEKYDEVQASFARQKFERENGKWHQYSGVRVLASTHLPALNARSLGKAVKPGVHDEIQSETDRERLAMLGCGDIFLRLTHNTESSANAAFHAAQAKAKLEQDRILASSGAASSLTSGKKASSTRNLVKKTKSIGAVGLNEDALMDDDGELSDDSAGAMARKNAKKNAKNHHRGENDSSDDSAASVDSRASRSSRLSQTRGAKARAAAEKARRQAAELGGGASLTHSDAEDEPKVTKKKSFVASIMGKDKKKDEASAAPTDQVFMMDHYPDVGKRKASNASNASDAAADTASHDKVVAKAAVAKAQKDKQDAEVKAQDAEAKAQAAEAKAEELARKLAEMEAKLSAPAAAAAETPDSEVEEGSKKHKKHKKEKKHHREEEEE